MDEVTILVVEDDNDINRLLCQFLQQEGYQTVSAFSGTEAKLQLSMETFHLILLDLMLPGITGEELILWIREQNNLPIIVLSAKTGLFDKVNALKFGADDYMTKPFEKEELLARVTAVLRRNQRNNNSMSEQKELCFKNLVLNTVSRQVCVNGQQITLTAHEFDILLLLLKNPEQVYTKEQLFELIWKSGYLGEDNTLNVHVSNLRKKLREVDETSYIRTVWGIGFKLDT